MKACELMARDNIKIRTRLGLQLIGSILHLQVQLDTSADYNDDHIGEPAQL